MKPRKDIPWVTFLMLAQCLIVDTGANPHGRPSGERTLRGLLTFVMTGGLLFAVFEVGDLFIEEAAAPPTTQMTSDALTCGQYSVDESQTCVPLGGAMPRRLSELLSNPKISTEFRDAAAKSDFGGVSSADMAEIPLLLLIHISAPFLSTSSPRALSSIVRKYPRDPVVARAVLSALDLVDNDRRTRFIRELGMKTGLSVAVQSAIAEAAVRWWGEDMKEHTVDLSSVGTPLLAALPPGYLAELDQEHASDMLLRLRNHLWEERNDPSWSNQPPETKRVWMELFKKDSDSGRAQLVSNATDGLKMLWAGATPDEISDLQFRDYDRGTLTRLHRLTKLQARSFLSKLYRQSALSSTEMNEVFSWMLDLSPAGLQRFRVNDTDFSSLPAADMSQASLPTLKQVLEQVTASGMIQGRISNAAQPGTWGRNIKDIGRLVYLIRATLLSSFTTHRLPVDVLAAIDTYKLSAMQARYLTNRGKWLDLRLPITILQTLHGLTRALPTATLAELRTSSVSNEVLYHLIESIPASHAGRSAVMFNKIRSSLTDPSVLEAVLRNPKPGQYLSLVSSREVDAIRADLEKAYALLKSPPRQRASLFSLGDWIDTHLNKKDGIEDCLRVVPVDTLSAVLGSARRELSHTPSGVVRVVWTTDTLLADDRPLVRGALLGLTCADVLSMDLVDFPVIMATFNRRRREAGMAFPKRLHHCLQRSMEDYLDMKKTIRRAPHDVPLMAVLEPSDIEAFGGYLLSTLRPIHIHQSPISELILATIGALSPEELLSAVPSVHRLKEFALQLVDTYRARRSVGPRCLFALGNLHMFLPPDVISAIDPDAWKLFVESTAGRQRSLTMCANSEQRDAWHRLAVRSFGSPSQWSAGVVAALGDSLAVLPADVMSTIRTVSWRDAADTLAERTAFHRPTTVLGSEHPLPFVEVCRSLLDSEEQSAYFWGVRRTLRFYLRASQMQLDTVEHAEQLVRRLQSRSARTQVYQPYRNAAAVLEGTSTTTTTTTPTPTPTPTPEVDTFTTTTTTTTTLDPFDIDAMMEESSSPAWMLEVAQSTTTRAPSEEVDARTQSRKTVIVREDGEAGTVENAAPSTVTPTTYEMESSSLAVDEGDRRPAEDTVELLKPFEEASAELSIFNSAETPPTTLSPKSSMSDRPYPIELPSTMDLPPLGDLAVYPNESTGALGGQVTLSETATKYSVEADKESKDADDPSVPAVQGLRRRRRATDDAAEEEMETQIARDVQIQVTCDAVRALGDASALALVRGDAEHMLDVEAEDCIEEFATLRLSPHVTRGLWNKVPSEHRPDIVGDLGRLVSAMVPEEAQQLNLNLSHDRILDTLSTIARHVTDPKVLDAVALELENQNPSLRAVAGAAGGDYSPESPRSGQVAVEPDSLLVALGPLTCSLPLDLQRLLLYRRGALQHAATALQGVRLHCNATCLGELARGAMSDGALGDPSSWTSDDLRDMGVIVAGLNPEQLTQLQRPGDQLEQPISGLTASAVTCMTPEQVQALGDHLAVLTPVTATAMTPLQQQTLTSTQQATLLRVRNLAFTRVLGKRNIDENSEFAPPSAAGALGRPRGLAELLFVTFTVLLAVNRGF